MDVDISEDDIFPLIPDLADLDTGLRFDDESFDGISMESCTDEKGDTVESKCVGDIDKCSQLDDLQSNTLPGNKSITDISEQIASNMDTEASPSGLVDITSNDCADNVATINTEPDSRTCDSTTVASEQEENSKLVPDGNSESVSNHIQPVACDTKETSDTCESDDIPVTDNCKTECANGSIERMDIDNLADAVGDKISLHVNTVCTNGGDDKSSSHSGSTEDSGLKVSASLGTNGSSGKPVGMMTKKNPKKSLNELHKQLLQKLLPESNVSVTDQELPDFLSSSSKSLEEPATVQNKVVPDVHNKAVPDVLKKAVPGGQDSNGTKDINSKSAPHSEPQSLLKTVLLSSPLPVTKTSSNPAQVGSLAKSNAIESTEKNPPVVREKGLYACAVTECIRAFNQESEFRAHLHASHLDKLHAVPCPFCLDILCATDGEDKLVQHLKTHVLNLVRCAYCAAMHDTKDQLARHFSEAHAGLPKKFNICMKIINNVRRKMEKASTPAVDAISGKKVGSVERKGAENATIPMVTTVTTTTVSTTGKESISAASIVKSVEKETKSDEATKQKLLNGSVSDNLKQMESIGAVTQGADKPAAALGLADSQQSRSRKNRKAAKPVRIGAEAEPDVDKTVDILPATGEMKVKCGQCTYTCNTSDEVQAHATQCHGQRKGAGDYVCRACKMCTNDKAEFLEHLAHHPGNNTVRRFVCPYCPESQSNMADMEDHVSDKHPSESFRFEVQQEIVSYLDGMLECPVCRGAYAWKSFFLQHVRSAHGLADLASYLEEKFPENGEKETSCEKSRVLPKIEGIPKRLIGEARSNEEVAAHGGGVDDMERDDLGDVTLWEASHGRRESMEDNFWQADDDVDESFGGESETRNSNSLLACNMCTYTTLDFDEYSAHSLKHGPNGALLTDSAPGSGSIIRKLLTGSGLPPLTPQPASLLPKMITDLDLGDLDMSSEGLSLSSSPSVQSISLEESDGFSVGGTGTGSGGIGHRRHATMLYCHLCPFQTNKTVHYRRHLMIHDRNETITDGYKCGYCHFLHPRLNCIKFHLGKYHGDRPNKMFRIVDGQEIDVSGDDFPESARQRRSTLPTLVLRAGGEKRPTARYEPDTVLRRTPTKNHGGTSVTGRLSSLVDNEITIEGMADDLAVKGEFEIDPVLAEFEQNLSTQMIYNEPVKCPKCDFTNRVRINIVRHLRLHKEEEGYEGFEGDGFADGGIFDEIGDAERCVQSMRASSTPVESRKEEVRGKSSEKYSSGTGGDKSLLRSILCEKPLLSKMEIDDIAGADSIGSDESFTSSAIVTVGSEFTYAYSRGGAAVSADLLDYATQLTPNRYQCRECPFVHRYPSKVKRHYFYKHSCVMPYRCGHCGFEAVESGRIRNHSTATHGDKPIVVLRQRAVIPSRSRAGAPGQPGGQNDMDEEDLKDITILDETISADGGDGHGDRWLPQFITRQDTCEEQMCKLCGFVGGIGMISPSGSLQSDALKRHIYDTHLRHYPYSCQYCGLATSEVGRIKMHVDRCHPGRPYIAVCRIFEDDLETPQTTARSGPPTIQAPPTIATPPLNQISTVLTTSSQSLPTGRTSASHGSATTSSVKAEPIDYSEEEEEAPTIDFYPSSGGDQVGLPDGKDDELDKAGSDSGEFDLPDPPLSAWDGTRRRQFRCAYCGVLSKWNRRDIRLHVLHVHMHRRVYTCRHCSFGNSKSRSAVKSHSLRTHPNRTVSIRDDSPLMNMITPIDDRRGTMTVAFARPDGRPIMDLSELTRYLNQHHSASDVKRPNKVSEPIGEIKSANVVASSTVKSEPVKHAAVRSDNIPSRGKGVVQSQGTEPGSRLGWKCKQCGLVDTKEEKVKQHIVTFHMKLKPLSCPYCPTYLWKAAGIRNHIKKHHVGMPLRVVKTIDEKRAYVMCNKERVYVQPGTDSAKKAADTSGKSGGENFGSAQLSEDGARRSSVSDSVGGVGVGAMPPVYRCRLCNYEDVRNDKAKYHVVKRHLGLRQFSCPHCLEYMWGRRQVMKHIEDMHPGKEVEVRRTFHEYEDFLKENILKIGGSTATVSSVNNTLDSTRGNGNDDDDDDDDDEGTLLPKSPASASSSLKIQSGFKSPRASDSPSRGIRAVPRLPCDICSFVTDSEMSLSAHRRSHRLFECVYCSYRNLLAARIQAHCLSQHPSLPVKYRQCSVGGDKAKEESGDSTVPQAGKTSIKKERKDDAEEETKDEAASHPAAESDEQKSLTQFFPCDLCPAHFQLERDLDSHLVEQHNGMYICQVCNIVKWTCKSVQDHMRTAHANTPGASFQMKRKGDAIPRGSDSDGAAPPPAKISKLGSSAESQPDVTGEVDPLLKFQCRLCNYRGHRITVIRHHVMSHLRYHPYRCPYCNLVRSVKSFPITKHVRTKHPLCEVRFNVNRDEKLERQVKNGYFTISSSTNGGGGGQAPASAGEKGRGKNETVKPGGSLREEKEKSVDVHVQSAQSVVSRKVLYQCTFCGLKTHVRTDMRHHLMREIHYKPFKCALCPYTEPCRWSMRKHFRLRHGGAEVEVENFLDPEKEELIAKMVEESAIDLTGAGTDQKTTPTTQPVKPTVSPVVSRDRYQIDTLGRVIHARKPASAVKGKTKRRYAAGLGRGVKSAAMLKMAIKLHRCPQCPYTNTILKLVRGHMVKHGPYRIQCAYCDYKGHYPSRIRKHTKRHHPRMPFRCKKLDVQEGGEEGGGMAVTTLPVTQIVHNPRAVQRAMKPTPGTVFLDGVPMEIPMFADPDGFYRCTSCDYQSSNREHYKMHVVIHKPPKWKCFYCSQKYPVIFRLRRHSQQKHVGVPVKWIDLDTGKTCWDFPRAIPSGFTYSLSDSRHGSGTTRKSGNTLKQTARKSTTQLAGVRQIHSWSRQGSDLTGMEEEGDDDGMASFVISETYSLADVSRDTTTFDTLTLRCHLCAYNTDTLVRFAEHLGRCHGNSPVCAAMETVRVEVLPVGVAALHRCGFCAYESYDAQEFGSHVTARHTSVPPLCCGYCDFASFSRTRVAKHCAEEHRGKPARFRDVDGPYTMSKGGDTDQAVVGKAKSRRFRFDASVRVDDFMEMYEDDFEKMLTAEGVTFDI